MAAATSITTEQRYSTAAQITNSVIKDAYGDLHEQFTTLTPLWAWLQQSDRDYDGHNFKFAAQVRRHARLAAGGEEDALPAAARTIPILLSVTPKTVREVLRVTGHELRLLQAGHNVHFLGSLQDRMNDMVRDARKQMNDMAYRDGTGRCGYVTAQSTTVLTLSHVRGLYVGQHVDIMQADGTASANDASLDREITAINESTPSITVDTDPGDVLDATVFYVYTRNARNLELMGLEGIVDNGTNVATFQGQARSSYPELNANIWDVSGAQALSGTNCISQRMLNSCLLHLEHYHGGTITGIFTTPEITEMLVAMMGPLQRMANHDHRGGFVSYDYVYGSRAIPIFADSACPSGTLYMLDGNELSLRVASPWAWADYDGSVLKWESGYDAYVAYLVFEGEIVATRCDVHGKITNITDFTSATLDTGTAAA